MKLFILMGASASGKDTILKAILDSTDVKPLITYTTRPIRKGETDGKEYHFVNETQYYMMLEDGLILESRVYNTVHGKWRYFTVLDEQFTNNKDLITINTPLGTQELIKTLGDKVVPIYIQTSDEERLKRAFKREQNGNKDFVEMCRRFISDADDFSEEKLSVLKNKYIIANEQCLENSIEQILEIIK